MRVFTGPGRIFLLGGSAETYIECDEGQPVCVAVIKVGPGYVDSQGKPQTDGCHAIFPSHGFLIHEGASPWLVLQLVKDDPSDPRNYSFHPSTPFILRSTNHPKWDLGARFLGHDSYHAKDFNRRKRDGDDTEPDDDKRRLSFDFYVVSDDEEMPVYSADPVIINKGP